MESRGDEKGEGATNMKLCQDCLDFILDVGYLRTKDSAEGKPLQLASEAKCEFYTHKKLNQLRREIKAMLKRQSIMEGEKGWDQVAVATCKATLEWLLAIIQGSDSGVTYDERKLSS
jgi:hypothetical protein